ncbi:MAG TPA: YdeI/OmpD-associated family protein [Solirubrobacteraceae bacterium]
MFAGRAGYRRVAAWWVISAKRAETRERRLATLIADCAAGRPIASPRPRRG